MEVPSFIRRIRLYHDKLPVRNTIVTTYIIEGSTHIFGKLQSE